MNLKPLKILGIMSGTSVDGIDLALCEFSCREGKWNYRLIAAETIPYSDEMRLRLIHCMELHASDLIRLDHEYGKWIGGICVEFMDRSGESADLIASHGHTVFHNPRESYTLQIGNGHDIAVKSKIPVIYDFRNMDIALGGQGAPLVPVGDEFLFQNYRACLNLGGFSNISFSQNDTRIAFDICPVNIALNHLAGKMHMDYDRDGEAGKRGKVLASLFEKLESIPYYHAPPPKSLGKEWFNKNILSLLEIETETKDILRTFYEHISQRISAVTSDFTNKEILVTGGGANNAFLLELIRKKSSSVFILPDQVLINFKEAIIFGFLGYLRFNGINNSLKSVTGAARDSCGGLLVNP
jgi:anhydro-N-acetylmuramic acid kinase